jgi:hypothetical protein
MLSTKLDSLRPAKVQRPVLIGLLVVLVLSLTVVMSLTLPVGVDWRDTYRPATLAMLRGGNPYDPAVSPTAPFFAAPWGLIPLIPLALFPLEVGRALLLIISLVSFAYTTKKLGAGLVAMVAFLLSPPVVHCLLNANVEWMPLLGFVLPPQLGLFLIAVKPQTGFAMGIFWLYEAWRKGGIYEIIRVFAPVTVALLLSFLLYGLWPFRFNNVLTIAHQFNASLWPMSLPVGLALIVTALRKGEKTYIMPASPCLSPYVLFHSWSSAVVALSAYPLEMVAAVIGLWGVVLIRFFQ